MLPYVPSTSYKTCQAPNQKGEQKCSEGFLFTRLWLTIIEYKKWCNDDSFKLWWVMLIRASSLSLSGHFVSIFLPSGFLRSGFAFFLVCLAVYSWSPSSKSSSTLADDDPTLVFCPQTPSQSPHRSRRHNKPTIQMSTFQVLLDSVTIFFFQSSVGLSISATRETWIEEKTF